ncbi:MSCRAMM family protein [Archangium lansingense]|uniref:MSCRAMM family protein n=1 Tax=Archangium lansingense TaxID=2995310 RepID=UPI003B7C3291
MRWGLRIGAGLAVLAAVLWFAQGPAQVVPASGPAADAQSRHEQERHSSRRTVSVEGLPWAARPTSSGSLHITGTVLGADGIPLAGAEVVATAPVPHETLSELPCPVASHGRTVLKCGCDRARALLKELVEERRGEAPPLARTTSDAAGRFTLEGLEAGPHALWTEGTFGAGLRQNVAAGTEGVTLQVRPGKSHSGRVIDEHGAPVPGALITVVFAGHSRFFDTLADANGYWRIGPLPDGDQVLVFTRAGFIPESTRVREDSHDMKQTLQRPLRLVGRVVHGDQPVAGVRVHAEGRYGAHDTTTDARGRFTFEGLRPKGYRVSATHAGLDAVVLSGFGSGEDASELLLRLGSGVRVTGRVRDPAGHSIPGATIRVWPLEDGQWMGGSTVETRTAADGTYVLGPLTAGDHSFRVDAERYVSQTELELRLSGHTEQDFVLENAVVVEGRVVGPDGEPLAGAELSLLDPDNGWVRATERSSEDGTFLLTPPEPRTYSLLARHDEFFSATQSVLAPSSGLQVVLSAGAWLAVELVDETGAPVWGARVWLLLSNAVPDKRAVTDEQGRFSFKGLKAGKYSLAVWVGEGSLARRLWRDVEVRGTEPVRLRLQLEEGLPLSGLVVDDAGRPVPAARVRVRIWPRQLEPPDPDEEDLCESVDRTPVLLTGPDGRFRVEHLKAGQGYWLRASKEGYEPIPDRSQDEPRDVFRAGTTDVRLVLERRDPPSSPPP